MVLCGSQHFVGSFGQGGRRPNLIVARPVARRFGVWLALAVRRHDGGLGTMLARITPLTLVWVMWGTAAHAQDPILMLSEPWFQAGTVHHTWKYTAQLANVAGETSFVLHLRIPECMRVESIGQGGVTLTSRRESPFTVLTIETSETATVSFVVIGPADEVRVGPPVEHRWGVVGDTNMKRLKVSAPEGTDDPSFARLVFGAGASRRHDDYIDFSVSEDKKTLLIENDGRWRPTGSVGVLLKIGEIRDRPIDVLMSLDFTQQTPRAIDGVMFGLTAGVNRHMSIGLGYALRLGKELSLGFKNRAETLVEELMKDDDHRGEYQRFVGLGDNVALYDGFPLADPRTENGMNIFPGNPIIRSYNHSLFLGVFIPFDIRDMLSGRDGS